MLLPHRLRPALRAQPKAGAEAAAPVAVAHGGDAALAVSHDPCTTSRSLDDPGTSTSGAHTADPPVRPLSSDDVRMGGGESAGRADPGVEPSEPGGAAGGAEATGEQLEEALLEDMQAAVDFSRAAYGYAFLCGGMSSIPRYLHMQTVQRSTFDIIGGVSAEANTQALCAVTGIPIRDVLLAEWNNTTYRCALHACMHAAPDRSIAQEACHAQTLRTCLLARPV